MAMAVVIDVNVVDRVSNCSSGSMGGINSGSDSCGCNGSMVVAAVGSMVVAVATLLQLAAVVAVSRLLSGGRHG